MKMENTFLFISIFAMSLQAQNMRQNSTFSLFSDNKANLKGDAITIIVLESTSASNNATTTTGRKSDLSLGLSANVNNATGGSSTALGLQTGNDFNGQGSTQTTGNIQTKISASVDSVLSNGNMLISGNKKIIINGEEQVIHIKGVVRPSDIMADNSVLSFNISDAEISFDGNGIIQNAQKPGWLTKFFHWLF